MTIEFYDFCLRIGVAVVLAALLGLERSIKNKPMGLRAFMMVALGSSAFTMITLNFAFGTLVMGDATVSVDPTRVIQGVIGGIGFLGAGAIMSHKEDGMVRGMGTGSAVWTVGSIGVACAFGFLIQATFVAVVALAILTIASWFERRAQNLSETLDDCK